MEMGAISIVTCDVFQDIEIIDYSLIARRWLPLTQEIYSGAVSRIHIPLSITKVWKRRYSGITMYRVHH